jgi:HPt (histidine-containing phosphotransfer) domain-containing protein
MNMHWHGDSYSKLVSDTNSATAELIWNSFRSSLKTASDEWAAARAKGDYDQISHLAHRIRSSAQLLGFKDFAEQSEKIEQCIRKNEDRAQIDACTKIWSEQSQVLLNFLKGEPKQLLESASQPN